MRYITSANFILHLPLIPRSGDAWLAWAAIHLLLLACAKRIK